MGMVATTVALVLGLLVYSAKSFYDTQTAEVTQLAANVVPARSRTRPLRP
jgi:hypothetical protein